MALADAGANTNVLKLPENACLELPENISFEDGTFIACTGATAYNAVQQLRGKAVRNVVVFGLGPCLLYTSPSPRDAHESRMPSSA